MNSLREIIKDAEERRVAIGHFNISELAALKAIFKAARDVGVPVIIGVSEGEREFIGTRQAAALIESLRAEYNFPLFLNADHTYSVQAAKEAVQAGYDAIIFDGARLPLAENIKKTKEIVEYARSVDPEIIIEGELGYIGGSSKILKSIPEGAAIKDEDLTKPEEAKKFIKETGVDLLAPAVGNIHGMFKDTPNPNLNIKRIKEIYKAAVVPLVLHGGSGISDDDFVAAINAGISVIHINTEIRLAWRKGLEAALLGNKEEIAPYKLLPSSEKAIYEVVKRRLQLFNSGIGR